MTLRDLCCNVLTELQTMVQFIHKGHATLFTKVTKAHLGVLLWWGWTK